MTYILQNKSQGDTLVFFVDLKGKNIEVKALWGNVEIIYECKFCQIFIA